MLRVVLTETESSDADTVRPPPFEPCFFLDADNASNGFTFVEQRCCLITVGLLLCHFGGKLGCVGHFVSYESTFVQFSSSE
jgi:hypothetical protein